MAFIQNCDIDQDTVNTGSDSNKAMGPTALLIFGDTSIEYTAEQVAGNMLATLTTATAAPGKARVYPLFGNNVPIRDIQNTNGENVLETMPDGSTAFVKGGLYTRLFVTKEGGECLGKILYSMNGSQLGFVEVDANNQIKMRALPNGNYSFFPVNMVDAPLPTLASFTEVYKNALRLNFDPKFYIKQGVVFQSDEDLLGLVGLIDAKLVAGPASTTTKIRFFVKDICCNRNIGLDYDTELPDVDNFVLTNAGVTVTPSGAVLVANSGNPYVELTTTAQTGGTTVLVRLAAASVLLGNGLAFEGTNTLSVAIPA
jgi:hypothetical protein